MLLEYRNHIIPGLMAILVTSVSTRYALTIFYTFFNMEMEYNAFYLPLVEFTNESIILTQSHDRGFDLLLYK
jgi:hypothetical protein